MASRRRFYRYELAVTPRLSQVVVDVADSQTVTYIKLLYCYINIYIVEWVNKGMTLPVNCKSSLILNVILFTKTIIG